MFGTNDDGTYNLNWFRNLKAWSEQLRNNSSMNDWRAIETAPRDGTPVDLWHKDGFRLTDEWWVEEDGEAYWVGSLLDDSAFTHWKPVTSPDC